MQLEDRIELPVSRQEVWDAVIDPATLSSCVPGVRNVRVLDNTHYEADLEVALPFMSLRFAVRGELQEAEPGRRLRVSMVGQPAGFAGAFRGLMDFALSDGDQGGSVACYTLDLQFTGRLASLGEALLRSTARSLAQEFALRLRRRWAA